MSSSHALMTHHLNLANQNIEPFCVNNQSISFNFQCSIDSAPTKELRQLLDTRYGANENQYIIQTFNIAMADSMVSDAINNAVSDSLSKEWKQFLDKQNSYKRKNLYTPSYQLLNLQTYEGKDAVLITWKQANTLTFNLKNVDDLPKLLRNTLFISNKEYIFIPALTEIKLSTLQYHAGLHKLYGRDSYRQVLSAAIIKEIAIKPKIVRLIGQTSTGLNDLHHDVDISTDHDFFKLTVTDKKCGVETQHLFQQEYLMSFSFFIAGTKLGLLKTEVSYKTRTNDLFNAVTGKDTCLLRR